VIAAVVTPQMYAAEKQNTQTTLPTAISVLVCMAVSVAVILLVNFHLTPNQLTVSNSLENYYETLT